MFKSASLNIILYSLISVSSMLSLGSCFGNRYHTPDAELQKRFLESDTEFAFLLNQVNGDNLLQHINKTSIGYGNREYATEQDSKELQSLGISPETIALMKNAMNKIGIVKVVSGSKKVEFRIDQGSISNGDSFKGYAYFKEDQPKTLVESLDRYRCSPQMKDQVGNCLAFKRLRGNWYLFLFISG